MSSHQSIDVYRPRRGDDVEAWLLRMRDAYLPEWQPDQWRAVDRLLDDYREHADYGLTLYAQNDHRGDP